MPEIVITQNDQKRIVEASQGDTIVFRLEENPTTGYEWEVGTIKGSILELIDSKYLESPGILMGRGGMRVMRYLARSIGNQEFHLRLRRSWDPRNEALNRLDVTVQVR
jgi:inhibitor of cysteine peptidase